jgi:hypothetical protein
MSEISNTFLTLSNGTLQRACKRLGPLIPAEEAVGTLTNEGAR